MIRHISIFYLKKEAGSNELVRRRLEELKEELQKEMTGIIDYKIGVPAGIQPAKTDGMPGAPSSDGTAIPEFGDLVQVIDFADQASADAYPKSRGHIQLMKATGSMIKKVAAIDAEM